MKLESATFDLDGTLLDTMGDLATACNLMLAELGLPQRSEAEVRSFVGQGMVNLVTRCLTFSSTPDVAQVEQATLVFKHHYGIENGRSASLYPGVLEGLEAWKATGIPLAVVTNKPGNFTAPLLERTGLARFFQLQVSGDTTPYKKPHPEPILYACRLMKSRPEHNVHIGDSRFDAEAARAAGSLAYCVPYGYSESQLVDSVDCDALVSDLNVALQQLRHFI